MSDVLSKCVDLPCQNTNAKEHNVYIVENSGIIRATLRKHICQSSGIKVAGESLYSENYTQKVQDSRANVILFSSFVKNERNLQAVKDIKKDLPLIKPIILTPEIDEEEFCQTVIAGAKGYCAQNSEADELLRAIKIVSKGGCYYDNNMGNFIFRIIFHMGQMKQLPIDKPVEEQFDLTSREFEVIMVAGRCKNYDEIAKRLCISRHTVKMHLSSIYRKLGVKNKLEAIMKIHSKFYEFRF